MSSSPVAPEDGAPARDPHRIQDLVWGAALTLLFGFVYAVSFQARYYGDGSGLVGFFLEGTGREYYNVLFLPACRLVAAVLPGLDPVLVPELLCAAAAGLGVGGTYLTARGFGLERDPSFLGAALVALAPATLFFGTTVEVHALHFGMVSAVAAVTLYAPWGRPAVALALVAALFPLLFWSHITAVLLGPGWVLLVAVGRARRHPPFSARALLLGVGPLLLASLVAAMLVAGYVRTGGLDLGLEQVRGQASDAFRPPRAHRMVWEGWLRPMGVLVPLAAFAVARTRRRGLRDWALYLLVAPSTAFYLVWGVAERGAYFLGTVAFLGVLAASALPGRVVGRARVLTAATILVQALIALLGVHDYDQGYRTVDRVRQVRAAVGEEGVLISAEDWAIDIRHHLPGVQEISIWDEMARQILAGTAPEELARILADGLAPMVAERRVAVDLGYRGQSDRTVVRLREPWLRALEEELADRFETRLLPDRSWPMLVLSPRE